MGGLGGARGPTRRGKGGEGTRGRGAGLPPFGGEGQRRRRQSRAPRTQSSASARMRRTGGGAPGATASATPFPVLAPPRVPLTCPRLPPPPLPPPPRPLVKPRPAPTLPGPAGPPPPAGCDSAPTSGTGDGARTALDGPRARVTATPLPPARPPTTHTRCTPWATPTGVPARPSRQRRTDGPAPERPPPRPWEGHRPLGGDRPP